MTDDTMTLELTAVPPLVKEPELIESDINVRISPILQKVADVTVNSEKREKIKSLVGDKVNAIRIMGAGSARYVDDNSRVFWSSPDYTQSENSVTKLASGAIYRVVAGRILYEVYPDSIVVVGGSYFKDEGKAHPHQVMYKELVETGVEPHRVIDDPLRYDSVGEIVGLLTLAQKNSWTDLVIASNAYHDRIKVILENLDWLTFPEERTPEFLQALKRLNYEDLKITFVPAENVIEEFDPKIYEKFVAPYLTEEYLNKRRESENKGIKDISNGHYDRFYPTIADKVTLYKSPQS